MRMHARHVDAIVGTPRKLNGRTLVELAAPQPGMFIPAIDHGDLVTAGSSIGELVVLGRSSSLIAARVAGLALNMIELDGHADLTPRAVGYGERLCALDLERTAEAAREAAPVAQSNVFRAPTSGRFYGRPAPGKPAFVEAGQPLTPGTTICLLEVMKTFHRVAYAGEPVRVKQVLVADGADVNAGDPLLSLE